ncbi:MAG: 3',5'-cyclic-nucleotide phosphodiesterase [Candidatus Rokubacteria bacterium]|nr:3',5'-cyclic-nucleotide phosphodiesterase [Candidatus Rokubacteria bacterium]
MKIRVLGAFGSEGVGQRPSAFLIDDRVLVDAGGVTGALTVAEQLAIDHALISHSHLDHIAGLVFLTETLAFHRRRRPVTVSSTAPVVEALRVSVFNNVLWPDFAQIPDATAPVIAYRTLAADAEQRVGDLWVTPIAVSHTIPTVGFIIHDGSRGFVYSGDTGPTAALWKAVRGLTGVRAIVLECAFPNRLADLADASGHMTPALIERELDKLPPDVPVWIFHVKPQFYEETAEELARLGTSRVQILEQDKSYAL